jgi:hypothetical protein
MQDSKNILEHEILNTLYVKTSLMMVGQPAPEGEFIPIYKRDYNYAKIHFGTLVDILNNPKKYDKNNAVQDIIVKYKEVDVKRYNFIDVSNAIEVLLFNGHVTEINVKNSHFQTTLRSIVLTDKGAIDYRLGYYLNEKEKQDSIIRSYEIQRRDKWLKKNWYIVEILKYIMGGIIGAAIALAITQIHK